MMMMIELHNLNPFITFFLMRSDGYFCFKSESSFLSTGFDLVFRRISLFIYWLMFDLKITVVMMVFHKKEWWWSEMSSSGDGNVCCCRLIWFSHSSFDKKRKKENQIKHHHQFELMWSHHYERWRCFFSRVTLYHCYVWFDFSFDFTFPFFSTSPPHISFLFDI